MALPRSFQIKTAHGRDWEVRWDAEGLRIFDRGAELEEDMAAFKAVEFAGFDSPNGHCSSCQCDECMAGLRSHPGI